MKETIKKFLHILHDSPCAPFFKVLYDGYTMLHYRLLTVKWKIQGHGKPTKEEARQVVDNVTFIFKSFERQSMAKRLYRNIQKYYPGARVIIADDSRKPLKLIGTSLEVVQLPFNQGLSYGLNRAIQKVETPFTMRMDDDMLLTPFSKIHGQLEFLNEHSEVDLVAVQACTPPLMTPPQESAKQYIKFSMKNAPKPLITAHKTKLDNTHFVMGKTPNVFLIRTEKYKQLGYDDAIRMIDHHEFFMRAAGVLVSAMDISAFVFHYHNRFDRHYDTYRSDFLFDKIYIAKKHNL